MGNGIGRKYKEDIFVSEDMILCVGEKVVAEIMCMGNMIW